MAVGEFINITNYRQFENVGREVVELADLDPALVFSAALPGFLGNIFEDVGAWPDRQQKGFEFPSKLAGAVSVAPREKAPQGGYDLKHIVANPGWEIAGRTQTIEPSDFLHQGMTRRRAERRAMLPRLDWNKTVFAAALDVITATGTSTGAPVDNGAYSIANIAGTNVTKALATNSADVCSDTIANSSQSVLWPLRTGGETAANHDHTVGSAGASWTLALGRTHRDLITEHVGMGTKVNCYIGKTSAEDIRTVMKSEMGAIIPREEFIKLEIATAGGLGDAVPVARDLEGVTYFYAPDMDVEQAAYVAANKTPFYFSKGATGVDGSPVRKDTTWFDTGDKETQVLSQGFRDYQNLGCQLPVGAVTVDYV